MPISIILWTTDFEQPAIKADVLGGDALYLKAGMEVKLTFYKGQPLDVELPTSVDLEVMEAEVAVRGDTATGVSKKVKTETGLLVQCPNFVKVVTSSEWTRGPKSSPGLSFTLAASCSRPPDLRVGRLLARAAKASRLPLSSGTPRARVQYLGDYFRGRTKEECHLLQAAQQRWSRDLCRSCPVPGIIRANACEFLQLRGSVARPAAAAFRRRVQIAAFCEKVGRPVPEPEVGCGECHALPPEFIVNA
jgi:hypothetical protein